MTLVEIDEKPLRGGEFAEEDETFLKCIMDGWK